MKNLVRLNFLPPLFYKLITPVTFLLFSLMALPVYSACGERGVWLQVLGSGGPELNDGRASSGYLVWFDGKAKILVDMGSGSLFRFEQSGAELNDIDVILMSHFHVDHSADLPAFIKASYFTGRDRDLPIYGPTGNFLMPSTSEFVEALFGRKGAFRYLNDYLNGYRDGSESYRIVAHDVMATGSKQSDVLHNSHYQLTAVPVHHGAIPALAWRVKIAGKTLVFSGDMNNDNHTVAALAKSADLFIAHNAVPDDAGRIARSLHMPPQIIGEIAAQAKVKKLVLSHRMNRTLGKDPQAAAAITRASINKHFKGEIVFVDDLQCFAL